MEWMIAAFVTWTGVGMTTAAAITAMMILHVVLTDYQYPPGAGFGVIIISACWATVVTVTIFGGLMNGVALTIMDILHVWSLPQN